MLSQEQIDHYRQMTPGERLALSLSMLEGSWPWLMRGTRDHVDRKFQLLNKLNEERNQNTLEAFKRAFGK